MDNRSRPDVSGIPRADSWLAAGLTAIALGIWLLRSSDPFLLTLWGVGLLIMGSAAAILGLGMLLTLWR